MNETDRLLALANELPTTDQAKLALALLEQAVDYVAPADVPRALSALLGRLVSKNALLPDPLGCPALVFAADDLAPDRCHAVLTRSYQLFHATRLVVLELEREVKTTSTPHVVQTPATAWELRQVLVGAQLVWPLSGTSCGMPLTTSVPLDLDVTQGIDVVVEIRHHLTAPAPFRAVVLGRPGPEPPRGRTLPLRAP